MRALALAVLFLLAACAQARDQPAPAGAHPAGWAVVGPDGGVETDNPNFHGKWLSENGYPLSRCTTCHGDDYMGGAVGLSCINSGCHSPPNGPLACTTCHGSQGTPRPAQGAHWAHEKFCDTCHVVPEQTTAGVEGHASGDAGPLVHFGNLAAQDASPGAPPTWNPSTLTCANVYCHEGATSPVWTSTTQISCNGCHAAPPANHAPWSRVATTDTASCATCHPAPTIATLPTSTTHVDGTVELTASCVACHGSDGHSNPPLSLDGSTDPTTRGVGAHVRHLDGNLPDRTTDPLPCNDCHVVPAAVVQPGHFDQPEAQVIFAWGPRFGARDAFDTTSATCNVWCHFNRTPDADAGPGRDPTWTDNSGDAIQCNACHNFPPVLCRDGNLHPVLPPSPTVAVCKDCHPFTRPTHVNGVVDFLP